MKISALIVDDEELARERIRAMLADHTDVEIVGEAAKGTDAVAVIRQHKPDLLFLDVQMPGMDGFDVLEAVGLDAVRAVVFVTAYDTYAIKAFDSLALDYLLKPFTADRFTQAMERARTWLAKADIVTLQQRMEQLLDGLQRRYMQRVMIKEQGKIVFVRTDEIDWLEAQGNYVRIHAGSRTHMLRDSLKEMAGRLDPARFLRIHRSTIVNLDRVAEMRPLFHGEYKVILHDGTELTSGRAFRKTLEHALGQDNS